MTPPSRAGSTFTVGIIFKCAIALESADHARDFGVRRFNRKRERRALTAHRLVYQVAIRLGDSTNLADASVARDHNRERAHREAEIEALGNLRHRLLPRLIGQLRRCEALEQFGRLDHRGQPFELGAPLLLVAPIGQGRAGRARSAWRRENLSSWVTAAELVHEAVDKPALVARLKIAADQIARECRGRLGQAARVRDASPLPPARSDSSRCRDGFFRRSISPGL